MHYPIKTSANGNGLSDSQYAEQETNEPFAIQAPSHQQSNRSRVNSDIASEGQAPCPSDRQEGGRISPSSQPNNYQDLSTGADEPGREGQAKESDLSPSMTPPPPPRYIYLNRK